MCQGKWSAFQVCRCGPAEGPGIECDTRINTSLSAQAVDEKAKGTVPLTRVFTIFECACACCPCNLCSVCVRDYIILGLHLSPTRHLRSKRRCPPSSLPLDGLALSAAFQKPTYRNYAQLTTAPPPLAPSPPSPLQHHPRPLTRPHNQAPTSASPSDAPESPSADAFKAR